MSRNVAIEARAAVDEAIDMLNERPRNYGGHREADGSSTIDAMPRDRVRHKDGRIMRFVRMLPQDATPYLTALCTYRGRWIVVPDYKLEEVG